MGRIVKWRTAAFRSAFPAMWVGNVLLGKRPYELCPWVEVSAIAVLGVFLVWSGALIRLWARGHFVKGRLFTTGPYAIVRHPLYLGSSMIMLGVLLILNNWVDWMVMVPVIILFHGAAILYEERSVEKRFGTEWLKYKAAVPAVIPAFRRRLPLQASNKWSWPVYSRTGEPTATLLFLGLPIALDLFAHLAFG